MIKNIKLIWLVGLILASSSLVYGKELDCAQIKGITLQSYWFNDAELKVFDSHRDKKKQTLFAKLKANPSICVAASLELVTSDDEAIFRTHGYKFAIEKWMTLYSLDYHPKEWPQGTDIRKRIEELTLIPFNSKEGLKSWWKENHRYLQWHKEVKQLLVNKKAKINKKPVFHREKEIIRPEYYWNLKANDVLFDEWSTDEWIYGHAVSGGPHVDYFYFKIPVSARSDREAKRQAFHRSLNGFNSNDYFGYAHVFSVKTAPRIKRFTGKEFKSYEDFKSWWETNKNHLVLSEDGRLLIIKNDKTK